MHRNRYRGRNDRPSTRRGYLTKSDDDNGRDIKLVVLREQKKERGADEISDYLIMKQMGISFKVCEVNG